MIRGLFRFLRGGFVLSLLMSAGCATLPATRPLAEVVQQQAVALFLETIAGQQECTCCFDAQVQLSLKSIAQNGVLSGFVQARAPSFLKFTGLNPLGQPLMILVTDGISFRYVAVAEARAYEGLITAAAFEKYAPQGFDPAHVFFWLAGRLAPGKLLIFSAAEDREGQGFWLELAYGADASEGKALRHHVLFDPNQKLILRHLVADSEGRIMLDVFYGKYAEPSQGNPDNCRLPGEIMIRSRNNGARMELILGDWLDDADFSPEDFRVDLPSSFQVVPVE
jgi:hypothetical protein